MRFFTKAQYEQLLQNGQRRVRERRLRRKHDFEPVARLFNRYGPGICVITEIDPGDLDVAYALSDIGVDSMGFGPVSLSELSALRHPLGFPLIERDPYWSPQGPISAYIQASITAGRIVEPSEFAAIAEDEAGSKRTRSTRKLRQ